MALLTTAIGAYPKPEGMPLAGWHEPPAAEAAERDTHHANPTRAYSEHLRTRTEEDARRLDEGTQSVVREQDELGLDILTDGEIRREDYAFYHLRHLHGLDFENLSEREMRDGGWKALVPTVRGPVQPGPRFLRHEWRVAQEATRKPVKMTVPGPLTIAGTVVDEHYGDPRALCAALGDALNHEIRDLAAAGCPWIQVDEPLFARHPEDALAYGIDNLARCFHKVPQAVHRAVHVCCGYPAALDQADYPKADPGAYWALAEALDAAPVAAVSIEDAHRPNDLRLLEKFARTTVVLGTVDIASTRLESAEEIATRLRAALEHIDPHRLMAAPDCGLAMLPRSLARDKLRAMVAAAHSV